MTETLYIIISAIFDVIVGALIAFAAFDDGKTRIVRPSIQWALLGTATAHFLFMLYTAYWGNIPELVIPWDAWELLVSGVLMFTIYITLVLVFKTGIGGADTKVSSIMALYLGILPSIIMVVGHFVSAIVYVVYEKIRHHKHIASVPLMVFIGIGYIIALAIKWITFFI